MIIEIRGTGCQNKGAQLMAYAILQHYRQATALNPPQVAVTPRFGSYEIRAQLGLYTKLDAPNLGRTKILQWMMSAKARKQYGFVTAAEVDVILDASGFAFGDIWGPQAAERLAAQISRWKRPPRKLILLPQAIGPLTQPRLQRAFRQIQRQADLIFVRDRQSYHYVQELGGDLERVKLAPDFTILVEGVLPPSYQPTTRDLLIIPNEQMLKKTPGAEGASYLAFLLRAITEGVQRGLRPVLLFHAIQDQQLAEALIKACPQLMLVIEADPLYLKGIIGTAHILVASRFHALVSGLSQGVPVIGTSWSHKYPMLFADYGCSPALLSTQKPEALPALFDELTTPATRQVYLARLHKHDRRLKAQARAMWQEIDALIGFTLDNPS
ncbi:MAG: polysaccharide pyruvyl transferase family protein [Caldilineaceae bacterium]|nr:polysaccharide pyruvyl transferase family protein [Caldilineaceae bacterium]